MGLGSHQKSHRRNSPSRINRNRINTPVQGEHQSRRKENVRGKPRLTLRQPLQHLRRMHQHMYQASARHRTLAHLQNAIDKILTLIGITIFHLKEVNPVGKLLLGFYNPLFGIVLFFLFGVFCVEYTFRKNTFMRGYLVPLMSLTIFNNLVIIAWGAL